MYLNSRRIVSCFIALLLIFHALPSAFFARGSAFSEEKPVWKVAWIVIPEVNVWVGSELRLIDFPEPHLNLEEYTLTKARSMPLVDRKALFIDTADVFKGYIEEKTNHAVMIEITHIEVDIVPEFTSNSPDRISVRACLTPEIKDKYNLENYNTWMVVWPFCSFWRYGLLEVDGEIIETHYFDRSRANFTFVDDLNFGDEVNSAYNERELCLLAQHSIEEYNSTAVHEFLHTTEIWFRDELDFPLPYKIFDGRIDSLALHNPHYYCYGTEYVSGVITEEKWNFYADWLSQKVPDPRNPGQYLGIPAEAWLYSPTGSITATFHLNNGEEPLDVRGRVKEPVARPAAPKATEETGDKVFYGWYIDEELTRPAYFPHRLMRNVSFYAKWGDASQRLLIFNIDDDGLYIDGSGFYIDLENETLITPEDYNIAAYSVNNGFTWKRGVPNIPALMNKSMNLHIADNYDASQKKPAGGTEIIFPHIGARPGANPGKLTVNYVICADPTGATPGAWTLSGNGALTAANIQIAKSSDKKKPDTAWALIGREGIPVLPYGSAKETYLARVEPFVEGYNIIPAGKIFKITPQNAQKAPAVKADYKKEIIKLKKGDAYMFGTATSFTEVTAAKGVELAVSEAITGGAAIHIKKAATAKKPATEIQTITPAARAALTTDGVTVANGKLSLDKKYEVYDTAKSKWGGAPKVTAAGEHTFEVRLKATAKLTKGVWSGSAASAPGELKITCGSYKDSNGKDKNGVTAAEITP